MKQMKMECPYTEVPNANLILIHTSIVTASHKGMNKMFACISLTAQVIRNYFWVIIAELNKWDNESNDINYIS
jgi:hypothetical protein